MKKKMIILLIATIIPLGMIGCGNSVKNNSNKSQVEQKEDNEFKISELGVSFKKPKDFNERIEGKGVVDFLGVGNDGQGTYGKLIGNYISDNAFKKLGELGEKSNGENLDEEYMKLFEESFKPLFEIVGIEKDKAKENTLKDIEEKYKNSVKVGAQDGIEYYLVYGAKDEYLKGLSDAEKKEYNTYLEEAENIKNNIKIIDIITPKDEVNKIKGNNKIEFDTKDTNGNKVDSKLFSQHKITVVNIWGTECGPCVAEMPVFEDLYNEYKDKGVNILGIVNDAKDDETAKRAKDILAKKAVTYVNIIPDDSLKNGVLKDIVGTPTTILVNNEGKIVGEPIIGGKEKDEYKKIIDEFLK